MNIVYISYILILTVKNQVFTFATPYLTVKIIHSAHTEYLCVLYIF